VTFAGESVCERESIYTQDKTEQKGTNVYMSPEFIPDGLWQYENVPWIDSLQWARTRLSSRLSIIWAFCVRAQESSSLSLRASCLATIH
jgi:hypothetical protein